MCGSMDECFYRRFHIKQPVLGEMSSTEHFQDIRRDSEWGSFQRAYTETMKVSKEYDSLEQTHRIVACLVSQ